MPLAKAHRHLPFVAWCLLSLAALAPYYAQASKRYREAYQLMEQEVEDLTAIQQDLRIMQAVLAEPRVAAAIFSRRESASGPDHQEIAAHAEQLLDAIEPLLKEIKDVLTGTDTPAQRLATDHYAVLRDVLPKELRTLTEENSAKVELALSLLRRQLRSIRDLFGHPRRLVDVLLDGATLPMRENEHRAISTALEGPAAVMIGHCTEVASDLEETIAALEGALNRPQRKRAERLGWLAARIGYLGGGVGAGATVDPLLGAGVVGLGVLIDGLVHGYRHYNWNRAWNQRYSDAVNEANRLSSDNSNLIRHPRQGRAVPINRRLVDALGIKGPPTRAVPGRYADR